MDEDEMRDREPGDPHDEPKEEAPTPPAVPESMTDQESDRAEAEASAEAAIDDGRGTALPGDADDRTPALDLASLHLRLGSLALARSELETFAGRGVLDAAARIDLAEVRWRTGDLVGAGEVAREALAGGGDGDRGPGRRVRGGVGARSSERGAPAGRPGHEPERGPIDAIFAGMPRSSVWPGDPAEPAPLSSTLFLPSAPTWRSSPTARMRGSSASRIPWTSTRPLTVPRTRQNRGCGTSTRRPRWQPGPRNRSRQPRSIGPVRCRARRPRDRRSIECRRSISGSSVRMAPRWRRRSSSLIGEPSDSGPPARAGRRLPGGRPRG